ncbi:MAG: sugar nucleotide-binding protein [Arachnia sp.]
MADIGVATTAIPGLLIVRLAVHGDQRGWFKENWQRRKMVAAGLPDFHPVQNNMSYNAEAGVTRGIHAEPWDKLVSTATGRVFGAWVDLRQGPGYGTAVWADIGPDTAVFVPAGVGNAYQALEPGTSYSYLVNDHWSAAATDRYTYCNLADPRLAIPWPIPLEQATVSAADLRHPALAEVTPVPPGRVIILGAGGQVARALQRSFPSAQALTRAELDIASAESLESFDFSGVETIINAAGWTHVDAAEATENRAVCWAANAEGPAHLAAIADAHRATLVHYSSDYVFDGTQPLHDELEPPRPLSFYGASKAAGDAAAHRCRRHLVLRTSWVVGDGHNFVGTMAGLAARGVSPAVVDDQIGRLSFTDDIAAATAHLIATGAACGTYNVSSDGDPMTWYDIAREVYSIVGSTGQVTRSTTAEFAAGKAMAPRPRHSTLSLGKLLATGFRPTSDVPSKLREVLS